MFPKGQICNQLLQILVIIFKKLRTRIEWREQVNKQQLKSIRSGYTNLEVILGAGFLAAEHNFDMLKP